MSRGNQMIEFMEHELLELERCIKEFDLHVERFVTNGYDYGDKPYYDWKNLDQEAYQFLTHAGQDRIVYYLQHREEYASQLADAIAKKEAKDAERARREADPNYKPLYAKVMLRGTTNPVEEAETIEEQIKLIYKAERELEKWESEFARRMGDESLSSIILPKPSPSVDDVRAKYPDAAAELDARRAKEAAERKAEQAKRLAEIDPWNL